MIIDVLDEWDDSLNHDALDDWDSFTNAGLALLLHAFPKERQWPGLVLFNYF